MARKTMDFLVSTPGRDEGKTFHIVEMSAARAERWAMRALQAAARAGINVDAAAMAGGMQGVAAAGIQALMSAPFHEVEGLMDEMMECVTIKPDPKHPNITRALVEDDIEEVATRILIRKEILQLHVGFSLAGAP